MSVDFLIALSVFCFVTSITPGPNNLMLLSSGINFGIRRSLGHLFGVVLGFCAMVILVGVGISKLFVLYPESYIILKYISIAYLIFLAYKIANSSSISEDNTNQKPISFIQAVLFQWVNPKAWSMALSVNAVYAPDQSLPAVLFVSAVFLVCGFPALTIWLVSGQGLKHILSQPKKLKVFNVLMAGLLICSFIPMLD